MRKFFYILPMLTLFVLASCSENEEAGEYDNWQTRNQHYVDSIANLAKNGTDGWSKMLGYRLVSSEEQPDLNNNHYIYVQKKNHGTGTQSPEYNDSVRVHYFGRLIPSSSYPNGYNFGKSYSSSTFNEATDVPALMAVNANVDGFSTALMHMVEGGDWTVVIPYYLGYGTDSYASAKIPGYSTLIFNVKLARIYKYKIDTDTTWH
ncbi:MAG: FKBP-type peptidyl-prolyl cis-trans isomerase [Bacteroidaceae bacterium]|nr:FKBP-type peptidyl-prolyl cis-trans isomerase [Bacteroidaceae bacterium]